MVTIGMEALFLSFGIFINAVFDGSTIWGMAWYLVTMAVSFYCGAWCSARLSDVATRQSCVLHGVTTWGLATLGTILIAFVTLRWGVTYLTAQAAAHTTWGSVEQWGGLIWGGIALSLITAYIGGGAAFPTQATAVEQETPAAPLRRAG